MIKMFLFSKGVKGVKMSPKKFTYFFIVGPNKQVFIKTS